MFQILALNNESLSYVKQQTLHQYLFFLQKLSDCNTEKVSNTKQQPIGLDAIGNAPGKRCRILAAIH